MVAGFVADGNKLISCLVDCEMSHSCSLTDTWWQTAFATELPEHSSPSYWITCWVHLPEHLSGNWRRWIGSWRTDQRGSLVWGLCKGPRKILVMNLYLVSFSIQKLDCSIYLRCKIPKLSFSNDIPMIRGFEEIYRYVNLYRENFSSWVEYIPKLVFIWPQGVWRTALYTPLCICPCLCWIW